MLELLHGIIGAVLILAIVYWVILGGRVKL